jgi:hypothetical protein
MATYGAPATLALTATATRSTLTPMIHGVHVILYSKDADADRAFFRDVLKYPFADAGHGWLIFALPPAEVAVHPSDANDVHQLYLMCDDVHAFISDMKAIDVACTAVHEEVGVAHEPDSPGRRQAGGLPAQARVAADGCDGDKPDAWPPLAPAAGRALQGCRRRRRSYPRPREHPDEHARHRRA